MVHDELVALSFPYAKMKVDEEYRVLLPLAVSIFRRSPLAGASGFSMKDAMV